MADKNVNIKITADSKNAQKGIDKTTSSLNKLNKEVKDNPVTKLKDAWDSTANTIKGAGLGAIITAEVKILKEELKAIKETAEAFNVQLRAETKLATAAKNNPFLNSDSVEQLKKFASELQSIGNYGDEELIPMMTLLASTGRDQKKIMQIMSASLDIAAGSGENLDSVVENLNNTLNGEAGEIADLVPEIKNLSKEQLLNGEAIEIAAKQYAGMSEAATHAVGSAKQLEMAQGDLKETIGSMTQPAYNAWNDFWLKQTQKAQAFFQKVNGWLEKWGSANAAWGLLADHSKWTDDTVKNAKKADKEGNKQVYLESMAELQTDEALNGLIKYLSGLKKRKAEETEILNVLKAEQEARNKDVELEKIRTEAQKKASSMTLEELRKRKKELEKDSSLDESIIAEEAEITKQLAIKEKEAAKVQDELIEKYNATVNAKKTEIETRRSAGQYITKETELQDMLNTKLSAYVEFIRSGGDANSQKAKQIKDDIKSIGGNLDELEHKRKASEQAEEDARKAKEDTKKIEKESAEIQDELIEKYNATVNAKKTEIETRRSAGQYITKETELQDMLNTKLSAYVEFVKNGGDTTSEKAKQIRENIKSIGGNLDELEYKRKASEQAEEDARKAKEDADKREKERLAQIEKQLNEMNDKVIALKSSAMELLGEHEDEVLLSDTISATIIQLEKEADALDKTSEAYQEYINKIKELKDLLPQVQKAEEEATKGNITMIDNVQSVMETFASSLQSLSNSINSICETYIGAEKRKYDKDAESLELQLDKNIITYDQYLEKRNELDKQFAQKEYNIKMAEWSMNLATATAQAALSVVNALASGTPPVNIINAVTAGLLGAAQITAIAGAKPPKPSFSTGGFLTGNSYHGDKIPFNGNAGEAILNPAEQRNFLDLANGNFNGGVSLVQPINIVNNAGDSVAVSASTQDRQIKITVDKIVNSGLQSGIYNNGLQSANANMKGARYL